MATGKSVLLEGLRGKIGNLVFYRVGEELRIRSKSNHYRDAKTPGQQAQRSRVKGVAALYNGLSSQLSVYWKEQCTGTNLTGYNLFMRSNIRHVGSDGSLLNPQDLVVAQGTLPQPASVKAKITSQGVLRLAWDAKTADYENTTDRLCIAVYAPNKEEAPRIWIVESTSVERNAGAFDWSIPRDITGLFYLYGFFKSKLTNDISTSFYLGAVE